MLQKNSVALGKARREFPYPSSESGSLKMGVVSGDGPCLITISQTFMVKEDFVLLFNCSFPLGLSNRCDPDAATQ